MMKEKIDLLRLKEVLREQGVSGKELAKKVNVTPNTISNIISGNNFPNPSLLTSIAFVLNVDIRELFKPTKAEELKTIYEKDDMGNEIVIGYLKK